MNVNIVRGEPEQATMHDVMHVYMAQSVCMALTAIVHLECLMLMFA